MSEPYLACPYCGGDRHDDQTYAHAGDCTWRFGPADELVFRYREVARLGLAGKQRQALLIRGVYPPEVG